jgi:ABC-type antimicrobial peptide transport system permease subunit
VIGVVADVKFEGVAAETPQQVYLPAAQERTSDFAIIVRTAGPPEALQAPIENAIHDMNRDVPLFRVRTMAGILETSVGRERMSVLVLSVFAFAAVVLASIGVYGLVAHSVTERTHEIGVRMALGAAQADVVTLIVGQGLTMAAAGIAVGVAGALALAQSIKTLLFGVAPTDPATLVVASGVLLTVVMTARGARRSNRSSPRGVTAIARGVIHPAFDGMVCAPLE